RLGFTPLFLMALHARVRPRLRGDQYLPLAPGSSLPRLLPGAIGLSGDRSFLCACLLGPTRALFHFAGNRRFLLALPLQARRRFGFFLGAPFRQDAIALRNPVAALESLRFHFDITQAGFGQPSGFLYLIPAG